MLVTTTSTSTFKYVESTLEYIGSTLVYVGYVQSTLEYIGSALVCIAFVCCLVNIRSILGVLWGMFGVL